MKRAKRQTPSSTAFEDTWHWNQKAEEAYHALVTQQDESISRMIEAMRQFIGENQMMAYLVMMAARLVELHRVLKPTGSLYLHCDPTASHYLKLILDTIFDVRNFRNEIVWKRTNVHSDQQDVEPCQRHHLLLFQVRNNSRGIQFISAHSDGYLASKYRYHEIPMGRYTDLDDMTSPNPRPNMMYEWKGHASPPNGWRYSKETMAKLDAEGRIWYPDSKTKRPQLKRYLDGHARTAVG